MALRVRVLRRGHIVPACRLAKYTRHYLLFLHAQYVVFESEFAPKRGGILKEKKMSDFYCNKSLYLPSEFSGEKKVNLAVVSKPILKV